MTLVSRQCLFLLLLGACHKPDEVALELTPSEGPMSGYFEVEIDTALDVSEVRLGGIRAFDLQSTAHGVRFTVQGHPEPGKVDVKLLTDSEPVVLRNAFTWHEATPGFERLVAIGASLSQGVQGGVPTQHGQRHSPSRFVAQQAGAYHPVPLFIEGLFPPITGAEITDAPDCDAPGVADHLTNAAIDVLVKLNDEENNRIGFYMGMVDAELVPYNVATGNSGISTMLHGPDPDDFAEQFLSKFVLDLDGNIADPAPGSQLSFAEDLQPTVLMCADTYGNDLLGWRPLEDVQADLTELVDRLSATGAEVFLANIPRPTLLPGSGANEERDLLAAEYIGALDSEAAKHDNVHVIDLASAVEELVDAGLEVDGRSLTIAAYDGLLSTDGLHLSDVGYAYEANLFIAKMNAVMGTDIAEVDLDAVYPDDEHSPDALLDQGIDPACLAQE